MTLLCVISKSGASEMHNPLLCRTGSAVMTKCRTIPFNRRNGPKVRSTVIEFDIVFDVIPGTLPFLIGGTTLTKMNANVNYHDSSLGLSIREKFYRVKLDEVNDYLFLPFVPGDETRSHFTQRTVPFERTTEKAE